MPTPEEKGLAIQGQGPTEEGPSQEGLEGQPDDSVAKRIEVVVDPLAHVLSVRENRRDLRLLSSEGLIEVARALGAPVPEHIHALSEATVDEFTTALSAIPSARRLTAHALEIVARGNLLLAREETPVQVLHQFSDPIEAYLGSLTFLEARLDECSAPGTDLDAQTLAFLQLTAQPDYRRAVEAVAQMQAGLRDRVAIDGIDTELNPSDTLLALFDPDGKPVGHLRCFERPTTTLGEDAQLREMLMPPTLRVRYLDASQASKENPLGALVTGEEDGAFTFEQMVLVSQGEYPDRSVLERARVEHILALAPVSPASPEFHFKVNFGGVGGSEVYKVEIVTAEGWPTRGRGLHIRKDPREELGIPSAVDDHKEELLVARRIDQLGPVRAQLAEQSGDLSTSVIIVLKRYISGEKAEFRRQVIAFRDGTLTAKELYEASTAAGNERDTLMALIEGGHLVDEKAREARQVFDEEFERGFSASRGGGGLYLGGGGVSGVGFHTGASGLWGGNIGVSRKSYGVDPFVPPRILVVHPVGIQAEN